VPVGRGQGLGTHWVLGSHRGRVVLGTGSLAGSLVEAVGLGMVALVAVVWPGGMAGVAWRTVAVQVLDCRVPVPGDMVEGLVGRGSAPGVGLGSCGGTVRGRRGHHGQVVVGTVVEGQRSPGT
jgi:hypothetical protein